MSSPYITPHSKGVFETAPMLINYMKLIDLSAINIACKVTGGAALKVYFQTIVINKQLGL
jgi:hypothetical protein